MRDKYEVSDKFILRGSLGKKFRLSGQLTLRNRKMIYIGKI